VADAFVSGVPVVPMSLCATSALDALVVVARVYSDLRGGEAAWVFLRGCFLD